MRDYKQKGEGEGTEVGVGVTTVIGKSAEGGEGGARLSTRDA